MDDEPIDFQQYELYLYSENGTYICSTKNKNIWDNDDIEQKNNVDEKNINTNTNNRLSINSLNNYNNYQLNNVDTDLIISKVIKRFSSFNYSINPHKGIHYNTLGFNRVKISSVSLPFTKLIALGIFSQESKSSIIRIYLLNLIMSYVNYYGEKKDFFKYNNYNEILKVEDGKKQNYYNNYLIEKIFDTFLSIPIGLHFNHLSKKIFKIRNLFIKDITYKNYYLLDLSCDKIILNLESIHGKYNGRNPSFKTINQKQLLKELIYHCHNLKNDYIKKNNMIFDGMDYQNFFVKIEYQATYPHRSFIIKFLPVLGGMCIIHEYIQLKLSNSNDEELNMYKEKKIIYGYDAYDNIFRNSDNRYFENEHYLLKQLHYFIIESLFCSNNSIPNCFILSRKPKIYFSEEILQLIDNIINTHINKSSNKLINEQNIDDIINQITNVLYEEYIQIGRGEKIVQKTKKDSIFNKMSNLEKDKSIQITKNDTLIFLFNSIQYNKNINPNDITLDLNDERLSLIKMDEKDLPSPRRSTLISKKGNRFSIRLSDLLNEKISNKFSNEGGKFDKAKIINYPQDTEIVEKEPFDNYKMKFQKKKDMIPIDNEKETDSNFDIKPLQGDNNININISDNNVVGKEVDEVISEKNEENININHLESKKYIDSSEIQDKDNEN
jgi:hypothetical protein